MVLFKVFPFCDGVPRWLNRLLLNDSWCSNHDHIQMPWRRCHDEWAQWMLQVSLHSDTSMCGSLTLLVLRSGLRKTRSGSPSAAVGHCCAASSDARAHVCSRHPVTGRRHNWHCDVPCENVMNPVQVSPSVVSRLRFLNNRSNMRTNDTSSVPKETLSVSLATHPRPLRAMLDVTRSRHFAAAQKTTSRCARTGNAELNAVSEARESFHCQLLCLPLLLPSRGTRGRTEMTWLH